MLTSEKLKALIRPYTARIHNRDILDAVAKSFAASAPIQPISGKNSVLAALLGILPGVGQIYLGQRKKGLIVLLIFIPTCFLIAPIFLAPPLSIIDALVLCRRLNGGKPIAQWEFFWNREIGSRAALWEVSEVIKSGRTEEPIGAERRIIDNSHNSTQLLRNITIRREYAHIYTVEHGHSRTTVDTKNMQIRDGATIGHSVEEALHQRYAYTHDSKHMHEENVQVTVAPFKRFQLILSWKNILEVGTIVLQNQSLERIKLPYSIVVGLTFDQAQSDA